MEHIGTCLRDGERVKPNPKVLVMGALGRCGRGAVELLEKIGLPSDNIIKVRLLYLDRRIATLKQSSGIFKRHLRSRDRTKRLSTVTCEAHAEPSLSS